MGKNLGELNSSDVYPLSNLPDSAVPWGRAIEDDVVGLKRELEALRQSVSGTNRNIAAGLSNISDQIGKTVSLSQGGMFANAVDILFDGAITGTGGFTYWTTTPQIVPKGFQYLSVLFTFSVSAEFPNLEPRFSATYSFDGSVVTGTTSRDLVGAFTSPGPLQGNNVAGSKLTTVTRTDARYFDVSDRAGQNFKVGARVAFFSGAVPTPNITIRPDVSGAFQIIYHN